MAECLINLNSSSEYRSTISTLRGLIGHNRDGADPIVVKFSHHHFTKSKVVYFKLLPKNLYIIGFSPSQDGEYYYFNDQAPAGTASDNLLGFKSDHESLGTKNIRLDYGWLEQLSALTNYPGANVVDIKKALAASVVIISEASRFDDVRCGVGGVLHGADSDIYESRRKGGYPPMRNISNEQMKDWLENRFTNWRKTTQSGSESERANLRINWLP